jgi:hypothetical protein
MVDNIAQENETLERKYEIISNNDNQIFSSDSISPSCEEDMLDLEDQTNYGYESTICLSYPMERTIEQDSDLIDKKDNPTIDLIPLLVMKSF